LATAAATATKMTKCNNLCCKVEAENRKMKMLIDSVFTPPPHFFFVLFFFFLHHAVAVVSLQLFIFVVVG